MGTYASDDSDDEGSVVSVVRHGELASVVERRATQIRHVLRDGPPDSEEDTPPAVRVRRGDLDPFALQRRVSAGTSSRVDAGRGPSRLSKRGEKHANRDRHVVWRDERTTEGDPEGFPLSRQRVAYGRRRRSIPDDRSSPPRYRDAYGDAYGDAYVAETVTDVRHYASPTLLGELPELPEPGRVASLARRYEDRGRFFDPEPFPDVPEEFRLGVERRSRLRSEPAGFALTARAEAVGGSIPTTARSGVDAAREALDDVARDLRDAHERSAEKMRALARAMDARENRLAESALALRDVQRRLTGVLAAVDGDEAVDLESVDLEAMERADLDARGAALRAAAAEKAAELRAKNERDGREAEARAARAEAETARARAASPSAAAARETNDATRVFVSRERSESPPREASAATPESRLGTRSAAPASRGAENPDPEPNLEPKPPSLSRTRVSRVPSALAKSPSELAVTTPRTMAKGRDRDERLGAAKRTPSPSPSVPSALTRARAVSPPPRALGAAAPAEQTPAIPRERLVERFPEKTPSARAARVPAGALALSRTRQAAATVSAMKPPSFDGKEAGAKEAGAGSAAGLTRAGRRVGPSSPGTRSNASPGPEPSPNRRGTAVEPPAGVPGAAPTLRDGMSLGVPGADALGASDEKRPGESRGGLSRTRALGGETPTKTMRATAASDATSGVSRRPVDPRAAAVARSRLARTRR